MLAWSSFALLLLAHAVSAQFTEGTFVKTYYCDLVAKLPADQQDACIRRCSLQVASNATLACARETGKLLAECLCTDAPELAEMQACFQNRCPALSDRCAANIGYGRGGSVWRGPAPNPADRDVPCPIDTAGSPSSNAQPTPTPLAPGGAAVTSGRPFVSALLVTLFIAFLSV
ncbi:hypothetical protein AURDEDRAFT_166715 [Auricularia subglabra TFB-10046 SS5]|nr:hypothetical protein AURDEDRAFT_166715 [Auricularia subglabra TFB-10046 SS5]